MIPFSLKILCSGGSIPRQPLRTRLDLDSSPAAGLFSWTEAGANRSCNTIASGGQLIQMDRSRCQSLLQHNGLRRPAYSAGSKQVPIAPAPRWPPAASLFSWIEAGANRSCTIMTSGGISFLRNLIPPLSEEESRNHSPQFEDDPPQTSRARPCSVFQSGAVHIQPAADHN